MVKVIEGRLRGEGRRIAIAAARWNEFITDRLLSGALDTLRRCGVGEAVHRTLERARDRRGNLDRDFVGFKFAQHLVLLDHVADLFEPSRDGSFGNGFSKLRKGYFCHDFPAFDCTCVMRSNYDR